MLIYLVEEAEHIHVSNSIKAKEDEAQNGDSQIEVTEPLQKATNAQNETFL